MKCHRSMRCTPAVGGLLAVLLLQSVAAAAGETVEGELPDDERKSDDETVIVRTDVIDATVMALKSALQRSLQNCDTACRAERNAKVAQSLELDQEMMSSEAFELVKRLRSGENVENPNIVFSWIDRIGNIQRKYLDSVFKYRQPVDDDDKDALFYLDIGEPHKAAEELLANQRILTQFVADCSTLLEVAQGGRSGIAFKLLSHLADLMPYHTTFGCLHGCSLTANCTSGGVDGQHNCAAVMRATFKQSFGELQDILTKFFTTEMSEDDLLNAQ